MFWLVVSNPCSTFLGWCYSLMFLLLFVSPRSMLLLVLFLLFLGQRCYSSCYSLFLIGQHYYSSCYSLFNALDLVAFLATLLVCSYIFLLHHEFALFVVPCSLLNIIAPYSYSCSCYFRLVFSPLIFLQAWEKLSKFKFFQARFGRWDFFFSILFVDEFFYYPCCFWNFGWKCVCLLCVGLIGHCTFNFTHCIFFKKFFQLLINVFWIFKFNFWKGVRKNWRLICKRWNIGHIKCWKEILNV